MYRMQTLDSLLNLLNISFVTDLDILINYSQSQDLKRNVKCWKFCKKRTYVVRAIKIICALITHNIVSMHFSGTYRFLLLLSELSFEKRLSCNWARNAKKNQKRYAKYNTNFFNA